VAMSVTYLKARPMGHGIWGTNNYWARTTEHRLEFHARSIGLFYHLEEF